MNYGPIYGPHDFKQDHNNEWLNNLLDEIAPEAPVAKVEEYLRQTPYYSSETGWKTLSPSGQRIDPDPYRAIKVIVDDILRHFGRTCLFVDAHQKRLRNIFVDLNGSKPTYSDDVDDTEATFSDSDTDNDSRDFVFVSPTHTVLPIADATRLPNNGCDTSDICDYSRCISVLKVTKDTSQETQDPCFTQVAEYARQCILQQQHRHYILAILLVEDSITLCHFDRSGVVESQPHPIHNPDSLADAIRFVRIILRASMNDPFDCGVDPAWFYREGKKYVKVNNNEYEYIKTVRYQHSPVGRGSACFVVEGKESGRLKRFLVKKYWRDEESAPEYELLKAAEEHGVQGIARVIDWDKEGEISTRSFRKGLPGGDVPFTGRIYTCVVQEYYGESIEQYPDPVSLLKAMISAIKVHHELYTKAGILHRDINAGSIVLADPVVHPGLSVVIIDLEMAVYTHICQNSLKEHEYWADNVLFRSIVFLDLNLTGQHGHPSFDQDYLDDLESFIYVLVYLVAEWEKPLEKRKKSLDHSSLIWTWQIPPQACFMKIGLSHSTTVLRWYLEDKKYWKPYTEPLSNLVGSLLRTLNPFVVSKLKECDETSAVRLRQDIDQFTDTAYLAFMEVFETAIPQVEEILCNSNRE